MPSRPSTGKAWPLLAGICLAVLGLHAYVLLRPFLLVDDFQILGDSWTWPLAWDNVWVPANEHAMPLGRLTTWALVQLVPRQTWLPPACVAQGVLAALAAVLLLYLFVRRELGHPFYGLLAAAVFGVSGVYQQAVSWFAASFSVLALDTTLLALLAAQHWRQTGRLRWLLLCVLWCGLAPGWFALGILAGPLCCLYLASGKANRPQAQGLQPLGLSSLAAALTPLAGTAGFLAVSLPRTAERIMHLEHYQGRTAVEAFRPVTGLLYSARSLVDNLLPGVVGVGGFSFPLPVVAVLLLLLTLAAVWWWRRAPDRRLLLVGLGAIAATYLLVYSARAGWDYSQVRDWSRYQLFPQCGWTLFLCGGLPPWAGRTFALDETGKLCRRQVRFVVGLTALLFVTQLPRCLIVPWHGGFDLGQMAALRRIEAVDACCRAEHIDRDTARQALEWLEVPGGFGRRNGWDLLHGSPAPEPIGAEEARRRLKQVAAAAK
jgi:hypothetical protein